MFNSLFVPSSIYYFCSQLLFKRVSGQLFVPTFNQLNKVTQNHLTKSKPWTAEPELVLFFVFNKVIYYLSFKNQLLYLRVFLNLSILRVNPYSSSKPGKVFQQFMRANTHTWTVRWLKAAPSELYFSPITITSSTTTTATTTTTTTNKTITTTLTTTTITTTIRQLLLKQFWPNLEGKFVDLRTTTTSTPRNSTTTK